MRSLTRCLFGQNFQGYMDVSKNAELLDINCFYLDHMADVCRRKTPFYPSIINCH